MSDRNDKAHEDWASEPGDEAPKEELIGRSKDDYEIGYGKPPRHSQFKKNNKYGKGRKKGAKGLKTIFNQAYGMKVKGKLDGKPQTMTKFEAGMHQLANKHSQGDPKAIAKSIELMERYGPQDEAEAPPREKLKKDMASLESYLAMKKFILEDRDDGDKA